MKTFSIKEPTNNQIDRFFLRSLQNAKPYKIDTKNCPIKLDQNESPWDWPQDLKEKILGKLNQESWNRYPEAFDSELSSLIANYSGTKSENILTGPGSNHLIALLLSTLTRANHSKVIVARPSFALYEMHCHYEGIEYETWNLNANLDYDLDLLPEVTPGSIIIFASPNNPVGNVLPFEDLERMLKLYPDSMIIADEAYFEFIDRPYTPLLETYDNLILLRTFSKTMGAAGLRIGYMIAAQKYVAELQKLRLPFLLNKFALVAAKEIMVDNEMKKFRENVIQLALRERKRLYISISEMKHLKCEIKKPNANFLLLKFETQDICETVYNKLIENGILVRNVSGGPGLTGCLRASIGTESENSSLIKTLNNINIF